MDIKRTPFNLVCCLLLAGCAIPPPPSAEEALAQALPETTQMGEQFAEQQPGPTGPLTDNWIDSFQDPQLSAIIDEALVNNLNLRAAALLVEASAGLVTQTSAQMKPVVAAAGQATEQEFEGLPQSSYTQAALNVSWELDIWGRVRAETAAAEAEFQAMTAEYEFARLSLKAQVAKAWFTAVETRKQLEYAEEVVALYRRTLELTEIKYEFGDIDMKDVHLARADFGTAQERLRQVEGAHRIARRGLELLLGRYPSAELDVSNEFVAVPPPIPVGMPSSLLERRPDLVAAERRVAVSFNLTSAAKAARLPTIGISGSAGVGSNELTDLLGAGDTFWSVGANFLAPIYSSGALQAQVEIRTLQQEAALSQYGQRALVAFGEVENALNNENLLSQREAFLQAIAEDNRIAVELAQVQYENGLVELLNVLQMQERLVNSQVALISIRNARLAERINLHLAIGGDFSPI